MSPHEQRVREACIDWNGTPMVDGEPPRDLLHVADLRALLADLDAAREGTQVWNKRANEAWDEADRMKTDLARVTQERDELASARDVQDAALACLRNDLRECAIDRDAALADTARLRELLLRYGRCLPDCPENCDCGWQAADAALAQEKP